MGFLDKAKDKLTDAVDKARRQDRRRHRQGRRPVGDKTGGKHNDKIDGGADKAKEALDNLDGKNDDIK